MASDAVSPDDDRGGATLAWRDGDVPVSPAFDDAYFAHQDGFAETREVFIAGNRLPERWACGGGHAIAELGFGTGLNMIATVHAFEKAHAAHAGIPGDPRLSLTSFELRPLSACDMSRALAPWPELSAVSERLLGQWPTDPEGVVDIDLGSARLSVVIGDARATLADALALQSVDAWFLDGFSPAKNPDMWDAQLMANVFGCTRVGGTFSTYTAAGYVRRNLSQAGFAVEKVKGFANKRERLQGERRDGKLGSRVPNAAR